MNRRPKRYSREKQGNGGIAVSIIILIGVLIMILAMSSLLAVYPQQLVINDSTKIGGLDFMNGNIVFIHGNQVEYSSGDIISVPQEENLNIRITGQQVAINDINYVSGVRIIKPTIFQNVLFRKKIGIVNADSSSKIIIDRLTIELKPVTSTIYNVNVAIIGIQNQDNYNIELIQGATYIKESNIMIQLVRSGDLLSIYTIGFNSYENPIVIETGS